ncbi:uncharacterized protein LOC111077092 [Drosophila obscura]|uniref:uncharacterized protein LOC111077092 n=1 Tax=Drosophila obscura TaxID=7282 RepID=UPI000BA09C51|nr:uncharacterized protein LOC111077092 [Drosophila obscura]
MRKADPNTTPIRGEANPDSKPGSSEATTKPSSGEAETETETQPCTGHAKSSKREVDPDTPSRRISARQATDMPALVKTANTAVSIPVNWEVHQGFNLNRSQVELVLRAVNNRQEHRQRRFKQ